MLIARESLGELEIVNRSPKLLLPHYIFMPGLFQQAGSRRVFIMRAVDEDDEETFPIRYLQQRQVLLHPGGGGGFHVR